jgi:ABC-type transporter Mla maintaining outer membrane lipid asymmetry ATPase subunit MlaF
MNAMPSEPIRNATISIVDIGKSFAVSGEIMVAIEKINLDIHKNEFVSIVGTSGCGKSTLQNMVGGLAEPTSGEIRINGVPVQGPGRDRGFVFQTYSLFEWMAVEGNILSRWKRAASPRLRRPNSWPISCAPWGCRGLKTPIPSSFRAACGSAWPSRGRWSTSRPSC